MPKFRVDVILARTYGTVVVEAEDEFRAAEEAASLEAEAFDREEDQSTYILDVYETEGWEQ
jgi:regulator of RNase E activity RraA